MLLAAETEVFPSLSESPRMYISNYSLFHEFRVFVEHEAKQLAFHYDILLTALMLAEQKCSSHHGQR